MSVFSPYQVYAPRLPQLKPGHFFKVGSKYYQVVAVRRNRQRISISGSQTNYGLTSSTDPSYEALHGKLEKNRIVHIQYLAVENDTVESILHWGTPPLFSKDVKIAITNKTAGPSNPIEIDRWSYDETMFIRLDQDGTQVYIFECVEYEIKPYPAEPRMYLHLMANGHGIFVEK